MFTVTRDWINSNRTPKGAFTKRQVEALGLVWGDLTKGWVHRVVGLEITLDQKQKFEDGKSKLKGDAPSHIDHAVNTIVSASGLSAKHRKTLLDYLLPDKK